MAKRKADTDKERRIIIIRDSESGRTENGEESIKVKFGFISKAMTVMKDLEFIEDFGISIFDYNSIDYKEPSDFYNTAAGSTDEMVGMVRMVMAPPAEKRLFVHRVETMDELAELAYRICKGLEGTEKEHYIMERIWFDISKEVADEMRINEIMADSIDDDEPYSEYYEEPYREHYDEHFEGMEDADFDDFDDDFDDDADYEYTDDDVDDPRDYIKIRRECIHCDQLRTCFGFLDEP